MIVDLVSPRSVLDVGCGTGAWIRAFNDDIETLGLDELAEAEVAVGKYKRHDLTRTFDVGRFDLAICLEVAEHLPADSARGLIASLVGAAPVVAFSAAIPGQPGHGHVNCQWPDYWRRLFAEHGYNQFDSIRARVWDNEAVAWWYSQNLFLYSATQTFAGDALPERVVHPSLYLGEVERIPPRAHGVSELARALPSAAWRTVRATLGKYSSRPHR
jgi:SAM-dependent methyltransferase